jgi:hypothetical protein
MTNGKVDRDAVEKFFKWEDPRKTLYTVGGIAAAIGVLALLSDGWLFGLVALGVGIFLFYRGAKSTDSFTKYYEAVKVAKGYDFEAILKRSFTKSETPLESLLDFDAQDLMALDPDLPRPPREDLLTALDRKSVFLYGRARGEEGSTYLRWVRVGDRIKTEYSPIYISILYLTRTELIAYFANLDITRGDLILEETSRVFLKDVVEIRTRSESTRYKRVENELFFKNYEKQTEQQISDEIVRRDHVIRVTKTDGGHIDLPGGAPDYESGRTGMLDRVGGEDERFTRVAREIFKRINDAKAGSGRDAA